MKPGCLYQIKIPFTYYARILSEGGPSVLSQLERVYGHATGGPSKKKWEWQEGALRARRHQYFDRKHKPRDYSGDYDIVEAYTPETALWLRMNTPPEAIILVDRKDPPCDP